ncbi:hypothetical protein [Pseudomonas fluorescens]|uniref:hypothetical protein n=1 Tax=Pseudomonas fluorescens TaxID=294 RepID=UPI001240D720|nr:hypothetical protein [Pseudomonas fluorescens]
MFTVHGHEIGSDGITLIVAGICVLISFAQQWRCRKQITTTDTVMSLLNGASVFPFCLMMGASFSDDFMQAAVESKASLSVAGFLGLLFVCGEVLSPSSLKKDSEKIVISQSAVPPESA